MTLHVSMDTTPRDLADATTRPEEVAGDTFVFPASFAQQRSWVVEQLEPGLPTYNIASDVRITGRLDVGALQASFTYVVERHEVLRTVFTTDDGRPVQVVLPPERVPLPVVDLSRLPATERTAELARLLHEEGNRIFDLRTGPVIRTTLFRTAPDEHVLAVTIHHIAFDGWSLDVLEREISAAYGAFASGRTPSLPELPIQYADFAAWQREQVEGTGLDDEIAYWTETLRHPLPTLELFTDHPRSAAHRHRAGSVPVQLSADTTDAVLALARRARTTPFAVLLTAFEVLLHRYTGQDDIIVGSPVAGRSPAETEPLIGCFTNSVPLRADFSGNPSFRAAIDRTGEAVAGAVARQGLPFEKLVEIVHPERRATRNPIFQTLFTLERFTGTGRLTLPGLVTSAVECTHDTAKCDILMVLRPTGDTVSGVLEFDADLYDHGTMERFTRNFVHLVREAVASPDVPVGDLAFLDDAERRLVTQTWNRTTTEYARDATVAQLFACRAAATPDAIAVEFEDSSLTYHELDARANQLAHRLQRLGVGPEVTVGLCVERSLDLVIGVLGILKAGGAYVPLDPALPRERLRFMLRDTAARVVLAHERTAGAVRDLGAPMLLLDAECDAIARERRDAPECAASADSLAYVMYTSGSTGTPKGVAVVHRGIVRLVSSTCYAHFGPDEVFLCFAPLAFDASTFEIWGALLNGGRLVVFPRHLPSLDELGEFIERHGITTLWLTAALFRQVVDVALPRLRGVRQLLAGGDVLSPAHVRRVMQELPGCRVVNGYGPTENTTFTCCYPVPPEWLAAGPAASIPIGRPIANTTAYVLDARRRPVPIGVAGRLHAGGDGVARGYLNNPELTAERFAPDPFSGRPGASLYDTGDVARWRSNGVLEFMGRRDDQVKLRGYRIELGEIESVLLAHPGVRDAAVLLRQDRSNEPVLVAYYVPAASNRAASDVPRFEAELRSHLRATLPEYMIPAAFVALHEFPLSANGKLDRGALPALEAAPASGCDTCAGPRTAIEHGLVDIWRSLLPHRSIGIHDDFFEIGGHSLLALQMLSRIEHAYGQRLPLATLFETSTISRLGLLLESAARDAQEPPIVVLQEHAPGRPFAFVHGDLRGGGWYCRRLAPLLGTDVPFILFRAFSGSDPNDPRTIEGMAEVNVRELRKVQPHGPYRLGGFCVGGLVALEMARLLQASGEVIERLIVIDTSAVNARFRPLEPLLRFAARAWYADDGLERRARILRALKYYNGRLEQVSLMPRWEQLRWLRANVARYTPGVRDESTLPMMVDRASDADALGDEFQLRPGTRTVQFHARAAAAFIPRTYPGEVDVINCTDEIAPAPEQAARHWSRIARSVRVHTVPSSHLGLITSDLPTLAARMRECLDR